MFWGNRKVVEVLDRAVWGINPVLDLAYSDPLGIKRRTFEPTDPERNAAAMVLDAAAWVLDVVKFPGTAAWSVMTDEQRSKWWTTRLGCTQHTVAVAFPGIFRRPPQSAADPGPFGIRESGRCARCGCP